MKNPPLILALDVSSQIEVARLCHMLRNRIDFFKVGLQLFIAEGRQVVELIHTLGGKVFLDLKFNDIPNQVSDACRESLKMGVEMLTVHTTGGFEMMRRAAEAVKWENGTTKVLGVTLLTSLDDETVREIGIEREVSEQVTYLAKLAQEAGLDGVVASPLEVTAIREICGGQFLIVTPGIRLPGIAAYDQKRVLSVKEAIKAGASYIVVGRPIIKASDPIKVVDQILAELGESSG